MDASIQPASRSAAARCVGVGRIPRRVDRGAQALRSSAVAEHDPRPPVPGRHRQRPLRVVRDHPGERGVDVGALVSHEGEVFGLARAAHALGRDAATRRRTIVRAPCGRAPTVRLRCIASSAKARMLSSSRYLRAEHRGGRRPAASAQPAGRSRRSWSTTAHRAPPSTNSTAGSGAPPANGGQRPQAALVVGEQQVVAPGDGRSERAAAFGSPTRRVAQHHEAIVQALP